MIRQATAKTPRGACAHGNHPGQYESASMQADLDELIRILRRARGAAKRIDNAVDKATDLPATTREVMRGEAPRVPLSDPRQVRAAAGNHITMLRRIIHKMLEAMGEYWTEDPPAL